VTTHLPQVVDNNKDTDSKGTNVEPSAGEKKTAQNNINQEDNFGEINHAGLLDLDLTSGSCLPFTPYIVLLVLGFSVVLNLVSLVAW